MTEHHAHGFSGALQKPYTLGELQDTLRAVIAKSSGTKDSRATEPKDTS